ncbi:hypothetical protein C8Q77DRAFT_475046 [Trametes polyzona]|nr:hypothetical protein C8Q77DRAFT_475046 [Trametes polyzona]
MLHDRPTRTRTTASALATSAVNVPEREPPAHTSLHPAGHHPRVPALSPRPNPHLDLERLQRHPVRSVRQVPILRNSGEDAREPAHERRTVRRGGVAHDTRRRPERDHERAERTEVHESVGRQRKRPAL